MQTVAVIDYGGSNLRSVARALEFVAGDGARIRVTDSSGAVAAADRVVFPGQGAMGTCMAQLRARALDRALVRSIEDGRPFLGICLGLQTLMDRSDEDGGTAGLGLVRGHCERFAAGLRDPGSGERLKIPHMGWNRVHPAAAHPLWAQIPPGSRFYFVHSYYVVPEDASLVAARTEYGVPFACALAWRNVFATQFHPEKSQRTGLQLLGNFLAWNGDPGAAP